MTPTIFRRAGEALYGDNWQTALARDLDISRPSVTRYAAGQRPIPDKVRAGVARLLRDRRIAIDGLVETLDA